MNLINKTILITGGTSGIGLELVKQLCVNNEVIVISRSKYLSDSLPSGHRAVTLFSTDLANRTQLEIAADKVLRDFQQIDVLINNAAIQSTPELMSEKFDYDGIQTEIDVNFSSVCQLTYLMLPLLQKDSASVILNVNSGLALAPKRSSAVYCATKGALNIFSQSLSYQLSDTNIAVHQAFLPLVETNMTRDRGTSKLSASHVANKLILGIESDRRINDVGKAKLLRLLMTIAPPIARNIMRRN